MLVIPKINILHQMYNNDLSHLNSQINFQRRKTGAIGRNKFKMKKKNVINKTQTLKLMHSFHKNKSFLITISYFYKNKHRKPIFK